MLLESSVRQSPPVSSSVSSANFGTNTMKGLAKTRFSQPFFIRHTPRRLSPRPLLAVFRTSPVRTLRDWTFFVIPNVPPRHLNVLPPMSPSSVILNMPAQCVSLRHLQQSQKSPAMGGYRLWHSGRVMAGRCGHFDRTCHKRMPLSNV